MPVKAAGGTGTYHAHQKRTLWMSPQEFYIQIVRDHEKLDKHPVH